MVHDDDDVCSICKRIFDYRLFKRNSNIPFHISSTRLFLILTMVCLCLGSIDVLSDSEKDPKSEKIRSLVLN